MSLKNPSFTDKLSNIGKEFKHEIDTKLEKLIDAKCGEIYFKQQGGLLLSCAFCNDNFINLQLFSTHLYQSHPFVNYVQNEEVILKNENLESSLNEKYTENRKNNIKSDTINDDENSKHYNIKQDSSESNDYSLKSNNSNHNITNNTKTDEKFYSKINITLDHPDNDDRSIMKYKKPSKRAPEGHWKCQICNLICKKGEEKENHLKTHENVKRFICETCGKGFNQKCKLESHLRNHTGERPFKCEFCPLSFKSRPTLCQHERTHINTKAFKCSYCDSSFTSKNAKLKHEFRHTSNGEKRYECDLCGKKFSTILKMTGHRKRHKFVGKPFECSQCPKSFQTKYNLTAHERLEHRGEFNYKCDFCDKVFIKICIKRTHELSHTRIGQPFPCDLCEKKYATREGLYKHKKRDHSTNLPPTIYRCQKCGENFANNKELFREHCKKHNFEDKKFGCKDCESRFDSEFKLNNHYYRKHILNNNSLESENINS